MTLLKEIHDVETVGTNPPMMHIHGKRHDTDAPFTIKLVKVSNEWKSHSSSLVIITSGPVHENPLVKNEKLWEQLTEEVKEHPKVRLHLLF